MSDHPIQGLMQTAMENIKAMVDVNTIVGEAVETPDGSVILPISKVGFGFAAGGSDFNVDEEALHTSSAAGNHGGKEGHPFGGGSGGGVSIQPIAFLVVGKQGAQIVPLDNQTHLIERLIDSTPYLIDKVQSIFQNAGGGMQTPGGGMQTPGGGMQTPGGGMQTPGGGMQTPPPQVPANVTTDPSQSGPAYL